MFTTERILLDTNVLVYAYQRDSEKHEKARELVEHAMRNGTGVISIQNLVELSRLVTEKLPKPLSKNEARLLVEGLAKTLEVIYYDEHTVADALTLSASYKMHFFDALLASTMEKESVNHIATENEKDFKKIPGLHITNPFK